jgi:hypothetical protein
MLQFLYTAGMCPGVCAACQKLEICTDESMLGNCSHVVFQKKQNIFNPLASNNVERIRDHPCPLITAPILTRGLQASPAQRWIAAI